MKLGRRMWQLVLILRNNIEMESDLHLAEIEIKKVAGCEITPLSAHDYEKLLLGPALRNVDSRHLRKNGIVAYQASSEEVNLQPLFRRLSFVELVVGAVQIPKATPEVCAQLFEGIPEPFIWFEADAQYVHFRMVPLNTVAEWSDIVAKRSRDYDEAVRMLDRVVAAVVRGFPFTHRDATLQQIISARSTTGHLFHGLHVYKAKFFPRMVRSMLNVYAPCSDSHVLDPYVGSGTTLTEATMLGMASAGLDIDPLSVLISTAKVILMRQADSNLLEAVLEVLDNLDIMATKQLSLFRVSDKAEVYAAIPLFLSRRIPNDIQQEIVDDIRLCLSAIGEIPAEEAIPLRAALSDAISRKLKFRFLGLGYGRFSLNIMQGRIVQMFRDNLKYLANTVGVWQWLRDTGQCSLPHAKVQVGDARSLPYENDTFDFVMTSPPYMPASSGRENYLKSKSLAMTALGIVSTDEIDTYERMQVGSVHRAEEIEDLPPKAREVVAWMASDEVRKVKAPATASYFADIARSLREIRRVLRPGGRCAFVIARQHTFYRYQSRDIVRVVDNAEVVSEIAERSGFGVSEAIHVELNKQNAVARPRSLDAYYETILILQR